MKILAIDPSEDDLTKLSVIVHDHLPGTELLTSRDGPRGIEMALRENPEVILVDIAMPGTDSFEICRRLKANELVASIPVVFLIPQGTDDSSRVKALESGAEVFLVKPINGFELTAQLRAMAKIKSAVSTQRIEKEQRAALVDERTRELVHELEERRRVERQLRKQAALLDASNDAIFVCGLDYTITYWNGGAERVFGWKRHEALGRNIAELSEFDRDGLDAALHDLNAHGFWSGELKRSGRDGKEFITFCRRVLLRDDHGRPSEILTINTDITEKRLLEDQFLRSQRMEGIGSLAGGIAHDLNNILAPILMSSTLLRDFISEPDGQKIIDTVESCAQRGAEIISQLLTFARGKPGARVPLPFDQILREMGKIIRETFPRNIKAVVKMPTGLSTVLGDVTQLHQALMNLCVNARDAMPSGGTLVLAADNVHLDREGALQLPGASAGDFVRVSVTDTGTGIEPEFIGRLFEPFFTTKELGKGTGLGLAAVSGIARGHGGFVNVRSKLGEGSTFEIYFPATAWATPADPAEIVLLAPRRSGELVLVVDDEESIRDVIRRTMENHGYRVVVASEGTQAVALFSEHRQDIRVAITDMMMPGMEGPELVKALRRIDPDLPIICMTGLSGWEGIKDFGELEPPFTLIKPFASEKLLNIVHVALEVAPDRAQLRKNPA